MGNIRFGTDGWRDVIAAEFTVDNVARVAVALSKWVLNKFGQAGVVVGYDCRFGGKMFAETVAKVLSLRGIRVYLSPDFVTTPMVSYGIIALNAQAGVMITASHNPPEYNGIKLKSLYGGPLDSQKTRIIEGLIPEANEVSLDAISWDARLSEDTIVYTDLEHLYLEYVRKHFDVKAMQDAGLKIAFDAMYGSGQRIFSRLFPEAKLFHCEVNPTFCNMPPEPVPSHLMEFSEAIKNDENTDLGIAVDGDADRLALIDPEGNYIDAHHIILLLIHYLAGYKKRKGKVVTGFSSTVKIEKLSAHYGLEVQRVPSGFNEISSIMQREEVLVGGEESGGISVISHIPERDGIWTGLEILQFMKETGKGIRELLKEVEALAGPFFCNRVDFRMSPEQIQRVMKRCREEGFEHFGDFPVSHAVEFDGYKYFFNDHEWLMIRSSGTEPVLRLYAEAESRERVDTIMKAGFDSVSKDIPG